MRQRAPDAVAGAQCSVRSRIVISFLTMLANDGQELRRWAEGNRVLFTILMMACGGEITAGRCVDGDGVRHHFGVQFSLSKSLFSGSWVKVSLCVLAARLLLPAGRSIQPE